MAGSLLKYTAPNGKSVYTTSPEGAVNMFKSSGITVDPSQLNVGAASGGPFRSMQEPTTPTGSKAPTDGMAPVQAPAMTAVFTPPDTKTKTPAPATISAEKGQKFISNVGTQLNNLNQDRTAQQQYQQQQQSAQANAQIQANQQQQNQQPRPATAGSLPEQIDAILGNLGETRSALTQEASTQLEDVGDELNATQKSYDTAFSKTYKTLNDISNGIFPLSPTEQAIVSSTQAMMGYARDQLAEANAAYVGGVTAAGLSSGAAMYTPELYLSNIHTAVVDGQSKLVGLEAEQAQTLAELNLSFQQQDYTNVVNSWNILSKQFDNRVKTLSDMQKSVQENLKDMTTEAREVAKIQIDAVIDNANYSLDQKRVMIQQSQLAEDIRHNKANEANARAQLLDVTPDGRVFDKGTGKYLEMPGSGVESDAFSGTIGLVGNTFGSDTQRNNAKAGMKSAIQAGDYKTAYGYVTQAAGQQLSGEAKTDFNQAVRFRQVATDLKKALQDYSAAGGDTNIFKGTADDIQKRIGVLSTDPKYAAIATELDSAFQRYRSDMSGAAFSGKESHEYAKVLPGKGKNIDLNLATLDGVLDYNNSFINGSLSAAGLGDGARYIKEYAEGVVKSPQQQTTEKATGILSNITDPAMQQAAMTLVQQHPEWGPQQLHDALFAQ